MSADYMPRDVFDFPCSCSRHRIPTIRIMCHTSWTRMVFQFGCYSSIWDVYHDELIISRIRKLTFWMFLNGPVSTSNANADTIQRRNTGSWRSIDSYMHVWDCLASFMIQTGNDVGYLQFAGFSEWWMSIFWNSNTDLKSILASHV